MPASISPEVPEVGIESKEFAFLPRPCENEDSDSFTFLQGAPAPCSLDKTGSAHSLLPSGATTPGDESSEVDDQSDYEFNADGQEEYYDFLREMGCDFQPAPENQNLEVFDENEDEDEDELEDEFDVEFNATGQEEYYDFLREMGCPFEDRDVDDEAEEDDEEEVEDWDGSDEWFSTSDGASDVTGDSHGASAETNQVFADDKIKSSSVSIAPGPSLWLQQALLNVAAQRNKELMLSSSATSAAMERPDSWELVNCEDFD